MKTEFLAEGLEHDKKQVYQLTHSKTAINLKDIPDTALLKVIDYYNYNKIETDESGEEKKMELLILICEGVDEPYVTQSPTFIASTMDILCDFFTPGEVTLIRKITGESKAGRKYMDAELV